MTKDNWYEHFTVEEMNDLLKLSQISTAVRKLISILDEYDAEKNVKGLSPSDEMRRMEAEKKAEQAYHDKFLEESKETIGNNMDFPPFKLFPKSYKRG